MPRVLRSCTVVLGLGILASVGSAEDEGASGPPLQQWYAPPRWSGATGARAEGPRRLSIETPTVASPILYEFVAINPCRQYDSRDSTPLPQGQNRIVGLRGGICGIPTSVQVTVPAVSANITVFNITGATGNGVFKIDKFVPPTIAWINYPPTETQRSNAGIVAVDSVGSMVVQVAQGAGQVDFVVDVNGYYTLPPITLSAFVQGDGTFDRGLHATGSSRLSIGIYQVDFDRDITGCFWLGGAGISGTTSPNRGYVSTALRSGTTTSLYVRTSDTTSPRRIWTSASSCTVLESRRRRTSSATLRADRPGIRLTFRLSGRHR